MWTLGQLTDTGMQGEQRNKEEVRAAIFVLLVLEHYWLQHAGGAAGFLVFIRGLKVHRAGVYLPGTPAQVKVGYDRRKTNADLSANTNRSVVNPNNRGSFHVRDQLKPLNSVKNGVLASWIVGRRAVPTQALLCCCQSSPVWSRRPPWLPQPPPVPSF